MKAFAVGWFQMTNTDELPAVTKSLKARTFSGISAVFSGTHKAVPVFLLYFTKAVSAPGMKFQKTSDGMSTSR